MLDIVVPAEKYVYTCIHMYDYTQGTMMWDFPWEIPPLSLHA